MLREKNLFEVCKSLFFSLSLVCFASFIALGNMPRFMENSLFSDNLLFSEFILYFFSIGSLFFIRASLLSWLRLLCFCGLVAASFVYGVFLQGMDLHAALYALRLMALLTTSFSLAYICLERFQSSIELFFSFLSKTYGISLILGFLFFFFFFSAETLWEELRLYNIVFHGDPHRGRFVSVYFDPNYYAAIVGMPMILSYYLYQKKRKKKHIYLLAFLSLSALLTWSRSGLFVLGLLFFWVMFFPLDRRGISQKNLKGFILFLGLSGFMGAVFFEEMKVFVMRLLFLTQDPSALSRFYTFEWGISFWLERPLFGVGYNFLYGYVKEEIGLNSLDSSLLSLLIQIGAIPFLALTCYAAYKIKDLKKHVSFYKHLEKKVFLAFSCYGLLILFFASHFNQLLFYPFWFLPFMVIFLFFTKAIKKGPEKSPSQDLMDTEKLT